MSGVTLWYGRLENEPIEFGPADTYAFDGGPHELTVWRDYTNRIFKRFIGKVVRISIEEIMPLKLEVPLQPASQTTVERGIAQAQNRAFVEDPRKGRDYSWVEEE